MSSPDPEIWVYPPPGAPFPPLGVTGSFGPVRLMDSMVLTWYPANREPNVTLWCATPSSVATGFQISSLAPSPVTYLFNTTWNTNGGSESVFCHMSFADTVDGNTVLWQFTNQAAQIPITWSQGIPSSSSTGTIIRSSSSTTFSAETSTYTTNTVATEVSITPAPTASSTYPITPSTGLSVGASVGIGIGVAAFMLLAAIPMLYLFRRVRSATLERKAQGFAPQYPHEPNDGQNWVGEGEGGKPEQSEGPEIQELEASRRHELMAGSHL